MLRYRTTLTLVTIALLGLTAKAHFQVILPTTDVVMDLQKAFKLLLEFTHPMEQGPLMDMAAPKQVGVLMDGKKTDLKPALIKKVTNGKRSYTLDYKFTQPGDYIFYVEPAPYWEPAEQKMIIHYTKMAVDVLGAEEGWDELVGFPVEIKPLSRPYSLWTGNIFRGIVLKNGKPVPFAEVEVEHYNKGKTVVPPADVFITQVIKADQNGVFAYAIPKAGWWGFAALVDGDKKLPNPDGKLSDVELGGLMWVQARDMVKK